MNSTKPMKASTTIDRMRRARLEPRRSDLPTETRGGNEDGEEDRDDDEGTLSSLRSPKRNSARESDDGKHDAANHVSGLAVILAASSRSIALAEAGARRLNFLPFALSMVSLPRPRHRFHQGRFAGRQLLSARSLPVAVMTTLLQVFEDDMPLGPQG